MARRRLFTDEERRMRKNMRERERYWQKPGVRDKKLKVMSEYHRKLYEEDPEPHLKRNREWKKQRRVKNLLRVKQTYRDKLLPKERQG